jgi:hypothetical protein
VTKLAQATDREQSDAYHFELLRRATVHEFIGGVAAAASTLMQRAVSELTRRGMSHEQILSCYREYRKHRNDR